MQFAGLYIHFPFCRKKCIYCDFYSTTRLDEKNNFLRALCQEIKLYGQTPGAKEQIFSTIYFGGGTPSLMSPHDCNIILNEISKKFILASQPEITMEVNPGAVVNSKLIDFRKAGINRLTVGVQSFSDNELAFLSRIHSAKDADLTLQAARKAGFENIGLDIMFGIPVQSMLSWKQTLSTALRYHPQHVSTYGLTFEPGTQLTNKLANEAIKKCDEEIEREMYITGKQVLEEKGYGHYEISNFALPGFQSQHNQKYWDHSAYLGLGPSAHSYDGFYRCWNVANLKDYCSMLQRQTFPLSDKEKVSTAKRKLEDLMLGLRQRNGIDMLKWSRKYNQSFINTFSTEIEKCGGSDTHISPFSHSPSEKLLTTNNRNIALTQQGLLLYNYICETFSKSKSI